MYFGVGTDKGLNKMSNFLHMYIHYDTLLSPKTGYLEVEIYDIYFNFKIACLWQE